MSDKSSPTRLIEMAIKSVKYERDIAAARVAELEELLQKLTEALYSPKESNTDGK